MNKYCVTFSMHYIEFNASGRFYFFCFCYFRSSISHYIYDQNEYLIKSTWTNIWCLSCLPFSWEMLFFPLNFWFETFFTKYSAFFPGNCVLNLDWIKIPNLLRKYLILHDKFCCWFNIFRTKIPCANIFNELKWLQNEKSSKITDECNRHVFKSLPVVFICVHNMISGSRSSIFPIVCR